MSCGKSGGKKKAVLCPFSFGIALAITYSLALLVVATFVMFDLVPAEMAMMKPHLTWPIIFMHSLWALIPGFLFGFVLALIYDCILRCCHKSKCCDKCGQKCEKCQCELPPQKKA